MSTPETDLNLERDLPNMDYTVISPDRREYVVTEWLDGTVLTKGHVVYPRKLGAGSIAQFVSLTHDYLGD